MSNLENYVKQLEDKISEIRQEQEHFGLTSPLTEQKDIDIYVRVSKAAEKYANALEEYKQHFFGK